MAVKKKEHEKLDDTNLRHVIGLLDQEKPITKKEACSILNISYNTARLAKVIEEFKSSEEHKARRKSENKGKAATAQEISQIAQDYMEGDNISSIAKRLFRSAGFVKAQINKIGIPQKPVGDDKHKTSLLPTQCIATSFEVGEKVWSACYNAPAEISKEIEGPYEERYGSKAYRIYVYEKVGDVSDSHFSYVDKGGFFANSAAYDIGSLKHLEKLGIKWDYI